MRIAERMQGRQGERNDLATSGNISPSGKGRTADIAAKQAGLGSGKTLEAAQKVVESGNLEVIAAMDRGEISIHPFYVGIPPHSPQTIRPPCANLPRGRFRDTQKSMILSEMNKTDRHPQQRMLLFLSPHPLRQ